MEDKKTHIDWITTIFLTATPVAVLLLVPLHLYFFDLSWVLLSLCLFMWLVSGISITAGYHRMLSHKSFEAKSWFKFLTLFFGAAAFEGPALKWCTDHRRHHRRVDSDEDPYSIKKGFFYAHMGWLFFEPEEKYRGQYDKDLVADKMVQWQYKYYVPVAIFAGFGFPTLIGWAFGDPLGGLVWAGLVRIVVVQHSTFFINSLAHIWGRQPYTDKHSARDNGIVALLTYGEGYHNYHHTFEADYRNGVRWYQYDPTKWAIRGLNWLGQTSKLKTTPKEMILRTKMVMRQRQLKVKSNHLAEKVEALKQNVERAQRRWKELRKEYDALKKILGAQSKEKLVELKAEVALARIEFRSALKQWNVYLSQLEALPA